MQQVAGGTLSFYNSNAGNLAFVGTRRSARKYIVPAIPEGGEEAEVITASDSFYRMALFCSINITVLMA